MNLLLAVAAAAAYAAGSVLQASAARRFGTLGALAVSPMYLAGLAADAIAWVLSLAALRGLPVYVVQAVLAGSLALTVLLAAAVQRAMPRLRDLGAVAVLVAALAVLAFCGREQPAPVLSGGAQWSLAVAGFAVAAAAGLAVLLAGRTDRRGLVLAVLAGLAFSMTALAGRAVTVRDPLPLTLAEPLLWVVVASGVAGTAAYAAALRRGTVAPVTALLWAVEVIVPAAVAIPLLGDEIRAGGVPAAVLALVAVVAATAVLAGATPE
ncbi:hypothetical protein GCM10010435_22890 [Winogradskya consettensis]|uniref:Integral membrane protein n=1 Tax=Winogradskya consettensis TaxID=113560 RepID=A0A919W070_9ACTN|nr:hypothetical protein [Actinoplanes consettensis]GIM83366.1 hypothetical protein Aco04nite_86180 [Actinoplanes consettensis]